MVITLHMVLQLSKVGISLLITSYVMCGNSIFKNGNQMEIFNFSGWLCSYMVLKMPKFRLDVLNPLVLSCEFLLYIKNSSN